MACGKPIVTTNWKGCRDTVDGVNGYLIQPGNLKELKHYVRKLSSISERKLCEMGRASRRKAELEFAENIVLESYLQEINSCKWPRQSQRRIVEAKYRGKEQIEQPLLK